VSALRLCELIDAELSQVRRAAPVKLRGRGSAGELLVLLAESQLVGGECFFDIEGLRCDRAGAPAARGRPGALRRDCAAAGKGASGARTAGPAERAPRARGAGV